ncbi:hypothetical protein GCM10010177_57130 [Actinomadura citrea]|nr:hypothetical protein GCM10010177_57130 [Actinomadura citrea]
MLDGDVPAIDELDDDPVTEDRFLSGHWHPFFVLAPVGSKANGEGMGGTGESGDSPFAPVSLSR